MSKELPYILHQIYQLLTFCHIRLIVFSTLRVFLKNLSVYFVYFLSIWTFMDFLLHKHNIPIKIKTFNIDIIP